MSIRINFNYKLFNYLLFINYIINIKILVINHIISIKNLKYFL